MMNHGRNTVLVGCLVLCCMMSNPYISDAFSIPNHHVTLSQQQQQQQQRNSFDSHQYLFQQDEIMTTAIRSSKRPSTQLNMVPTGLGWIASSYSNALTMFPVITKAATGFFLCGAGDILAQSKSIRQTKAAATTEVTEQVKKTKFDWKRFMRFAGKGALGTLIWAGWYDISDALVDRMVQGVTALNPTLLQVYRTVLLLLSEQFVACPIIYGLWEIPMSTVLNVGWKKLSLRKIIYEVKDKLTDMLIENAKVWTIVNILIYNVPVQFRAFVGNIMDIVWQSIVSDFAANCGAADDTEAETEPSLQPALVVEMNTESRSVLPQYNYTDTMVSVGASE